jgi:enoyl-CoA hydratase/carnithine racemase
VALVEIQRSGTRATLLLNRPEARNALSIEMCDAIVDAFTAVDTPDTRVVVLRGEGRVFCSGADFAAVSGAGGLDFLPAFERMLETVARFRAPTVAAIQGGAFGGGFQLATVCDFRVATHDARMGIPSSSLGILVNFENIERLVLLAGVATAKEILVGGRQFSGREAATRGLVTMSVPSEDLFVGPDDFAEDIEELAPLSVQGAKKAIQLVADHLAGVRRTDPAAVAAIDELVAQAYGSADLQEGLKAMAEKREPRFEGR